MIECSKYLAGQLQERARYTDYVMRNAVNNCRHLNVHPADINSFMHI